MKKRRGPQSRRLFIDIANSLLSNSSSMATSIKRKRGRPPSGREAFCIRMMPRTHDHLTRAARLAGYKSLSDWLDSGRVAAGAGPSESRSPRRTADVCAAVRSHSAQVMDALSCIREVLDDD